MKKMFLSLIAFAIIVSVSAQDKVKQKELGLGFSNFDNFALTYKFGHQKSMWRLMALHGSINSFDYTDYDEDKSKQKSASVGISFGKQFHSFINDDFKLIYGADLKLNYSYNKNIEQGQNESVRSIYAPGLNAVLGFNYDLNDHFVIGLELLPGLNYTYSETKIDNDDEAMTDHVSKTNGLSFGVSTSSALLTMAYRFGK
jgi:hypothetical protein